MTEKLMHKLAAAILILSTLSSNPATAYAAEPEYENQEALIPTTPSLPPASLNQKIPTQVPHCERYFQYRGKKLECDSNLGNDAQRLKPLVSDVPAALKELEIYESNRKAVLTAGYVGSLGVLAIIAGIIISHPPFDPGNGSIRPGGYVVLGGLGLTINSMLYGFSLVRNNEAHIGNAVQYYNAVHPENPIELQFTAPVNF